MSSFPTKSTYVAPFSVVDRDGSPLELQGAEIEYLITLRRGKGETLFEANRDAPEIEVEPDSETGLVKVTVGAEDITFTGSVWEELRIRQPDASVAVSLRKVRFEPRATNA